MAKKRLSSKPDERSFTESDVALLARQSAVEFLMTLPDIQEAGLTSADLELAIEDRGWIGGYNSTNRLNADLDPRSRRVMVSQSRMYWLRDPLAHQAVRLWTDYCFGDSGLSVTCDDKKTQDKIHAFLDDPRNKRLLSASGQKRLSNNLLVDGEIFFAVFSDGVIRKYDPQQITIISDPDDEDTVLAYKRLTSSNKTLYYRDWTATPQDAQAVIDPETKKTFKVERNVSIYHLAYDAFGKRGNGLLVSSLSWSIQHRKFMEARVAITQALSKFTYKTTVAGGPKEVAKTQAKLESSFANRAPNTLEKNPVTTAGGNFIQSKGLDLVPLPRTTGAGEAKDDSDSLKLQVCAGTGIMLHYFGDPSTGNLATATAMELPMLKMFQGYQKLWKDAYADIFFIVLDEKLGKKPIKKNVDLPPILKDDLQELGRFLVGLAAMFPEVKIPEILEMCLISLGVNNIDEIMDLIEEKRKEIEDQIANELLMTGGAPGTTPPTPGAPRPALPATTVAQKQLKEAYDALTLAVKMYSEKL